MTIQFTEQTYISSEAMSYTANNTFIEIPKSVGYKNKRDRVIRVSSISLINCEKDILRIFCNDESAIEIDFIADGSAERFKNTLMEAITNITGCKTVMVTERDV